MTEFHRYAVYFTPGAGPLGEFGAAWLGWDTATARAVPQPELDGVDMAALAERPRRYGFHATIKPPFVLTPAASGADLDNAFDALCDRLPVARTGGLMLNRLGRFLALTLRGDTAAVDHIAATAVRDLDHLRAPPDPAEQKRRATPHLRPEQLENLRRWGYPHVMACYRFHMTLTGPLDRDRLHAVTPALHERLEPLLKAAPLRIDALTLMGERPDGMFVQIRRRALTG